MFALVLLRVSPHLSVAPDTINNHVKTCREEKKSLHFFAPEYGGRIILALRSLFLLSAAFDHSDSKQLHLLSAVANVTTAVDIYSFGMCALEVSCYSVMSLNTWAIT